jgi:hypothetical protein
VARTGARCGSPVHAPVGENYEQTKRTAEILREQDKIARTLDITRKIYGEQDAEIRCVAMVVGVVSYLTKHYGSRRAYDTIQGIADSIPELPRG